MNLLRGALRVGAVLLIALGGALILVPRTVAETIMAQGETVDDVWIRLFGAGTVAIALFHVLILRKLDDLWWWCWAFVVYDGVATLIVVGHAAVGVPEGSAAWPWWLFGTTSAIFTGLYLVGLARTGQEKPLV